MNRPDDLDTIRTRLAEPYYGVQYADAGVYHPPTMEDDIERYAVALNRAMEGLFLCLNYIDQIQEVNSLEDVGLLKGEVPYARVSQSTLARAFTGNTFTIEYLRKQDAWRLAVMMCSDPVHDINVARCMREMEEAEKAMRLAHGMGIQKG